MDSHSGLMEQIRNRPVALRPVWTQFHVSDPTCPFPCWRGVAFRCDWSLIRAAWLCEQAAPAAAEEKESKKGVAASATLPPQLSALSGAAFLVQKMLDNRKKLEDSDDEGNDSDSEFDD